MNRSGAMIWLRAAGIRALRTVAQSCAATLGTSALLSEVDWRTAISAALLAGLLSLLTSLAGLPEVSAAGAAVDKPGAEDGADAAKAENAAIKGGE